MFNERLYNILCVLTLYSLTLNTIHTEETISSSQNAFINSLKDVTINPVEENLKEGLRFIRKSAERSLPNQLQYALLYHKNISKSKGNESFLIVQAEYVQPGKTTLFRFQRLKNCVADEVQVTMHIQLTVSKFSKSALLKLDLNGKYQETQLIKNKMFSGLITFVLNTRSCREKKLEFSLTCIGCQTYSIKSKPRHRLPFLIVIKNVSERPKQATDVLREKIVKKIQSENEYKYCTLNTHCCMKQSHINVNSVGWSKWIFSPATLKVNHCTGTCHTVTKQITPWKRITTLHCCRGVGTSSLMITFLKDKNNIIYRKRLSFGVKRCLMVPVKRKGTTK